MTPKQIVASFGLQGKITEVHEREIEEIVSDLPYCTENTPGVLSNTRYYKKDTVVNALRKVREEERERIYKAVGKLDGEREKCNAGEDCPYPHDVLIKRSQVIEAINHPEPD